jgi:hypothetical protein
MTGKRFLPVGVLALAPLALLWAGAGPAAAAFQLTSPMQLDPSDTTAVYPQPEFTTVPSPYSLSAGGNTLTFTNLGGGDFIRYDQGSAWNGDFTNGTKLLYNQGNGPTDIKLQKGVGEVGLEAQSNIIASHIFTISIFDGATKLLTFTVPGDGFASFIGARAEGSEVITEVLITSDDNDFAFGPLTFGPSPSPVPAPGTIALAACGIVTLAGYRWRRGRRAS